MNGAHFIVTNDWASEGEVHIENHFFRTEEAARAKYEELKQDALANEVYIVDKTGITAEQLEKLEAAGLSSVNDEDTHTLYIVEDGFVLEIEHDSYLFYADGYYCEDHVSITIKEITVED